MNGLNKISVILPLCLLWNDKLVCAEKSNKDNLRPNILWILNEDMDPDLGCYGNRFVKTPNIDQLSKEGIKFNRAYTTSPVCSPSKSSLFTGMYNIRIGAHQHRTPDLKPLPSDVHIVTELLSKSGYYICDNTNLFKDIGGNANIDFNFLTENVFPGEDWNAVPKGQPFFAYINIHEPKPYLWNKSEVWAKDNNAVVNAEEVDLPPYYPDTKKTRQWMAQYYQCISHMDWKIGKIIDQLKKDGKYDNTEIGRAHV